MDQQQQSRWRPTRRQVLWTVAITVVVVVALVVAIIVLGYVREWKWTGMVKDKAYPWRTLWDWLGLLIVPVVLAAGGLLFTLSQNRATQAATERRAQDEALQSYLDQMSQLLTDKARPLGCAQPGDNLSAVARARTLTVLWRLDGSRKGSLLQFLYEAQLINKKKGTVIDLGGAHLAEAHLWASDLRDVDLHGADLTKANLSRANLLRADLSGAELCKANFSGPTRLSGADLTKANLRGADLRSASLSGTTKLCEADLRRANLSEAILSRADLSRADLSRANLYHAKGLTEEQLKAAKSLKGATMPDGSKHP